MVSDASPGRRGNRENLALAVIRVGRRLPSCVFCRERLVRRIVRHLVEKVVAHTVLLLDP